MIEVTPQTTPNPNSLKFQISTTVAGNGSRNFSSATDAEADPIAKAIFEVPGVISVFMLNDFISVNKEDSAKWDDMAGQVAEKIKSNISL